MELKDWLAQYQQYKAIEQLVKNPQDTVEARENLKNSALQLALSTPGTAQRLGTEEAQLAFKDNPNEVDEILSVQSLISKATAEQNYSQNKANFIKEAPEKGLAQIVLNMDAPKSGDKQIDRDYEPIVRAHSDLKKIEKLLTQENVSPDEINKYAMKVMKDFVAESKNDPVYQKNPKLLKVLENIGKNAILRGHGKDYLTLKISQLYNTINEGLKDDKSKADYARYALARMDDKKTMEYLFLSQAAADQAAKKR